MGMKRNIREILEFREDISPFLVHLTKTATSKKAKDVLKKILKERKLVAGNKPMSDAKYFLTGDKQNEFCRAISFTETPLNEIHCLIDIKARQIELEPYGLVFMKEELQKKGVSPVIYLNNEQNDIDNVIKSLCRLIYKDAASAKKILPLISTFGRMLLKRKRIDFTWEREWRYPSVLGDLKFDKTHVFVGICPDDDIKEFEQQFPDFIFVDCRRNMKYYASKLVKARRAHNLKRSVV